MKFKKGSGSFSTTVSELVCIEASSPGSKATSHAENKSVSTSRGFYILPVGGVALWRFASVWAV